MGLSAEEVYIIVVFFFTIFHDSLFHFSHSLSSPIRGRNTDRSTLKKRLNFFAFVARDSGRRTSNVSRLSGEVPLAKWLWFRKRIPVTCTR